MVRNVCVENVIKWLWDFGSLYPDHPTTPMSKCYQDMMPGVCPLPDPSLQSSSVSESLGSPCDAPPVSLSSFLVSFTNQLLKWDGEPVYIISSIIACIVINLLLRKSLNIAGWIENLERGRWCAPSHGFSSGSPGKSCQCQWLCNKDTMEVEHMISIISFGHPTWHREQPYRWLECRSWK